MGALGRAGNKPLTAANAVRTREPGARPGATLPGQVEGVTNKRGLGGPLQPASGRANHSSARGTQLIVLFDDVKKIPFCFARHAKIADNAKEREGRNTVGAVPLPSVGALGTCE
jgi:hypothetical protein